MIDDGKNDPPYIKIENHPWSLSHFERWERELQQTPKRRKLSGKLWTLVTAIGRTYGGY